MPGQLPHAERLAVVDAAFRSLPDRYLGADPGFDATYHVRLCDLGHTWEVRCTSHGARVRKGVTRRSADVTLSTDADTWLRLRQGEFSGVAGLSAPAAERARESRLCGGLRGHVPPPQRPASAAADPRRAGWPASDLHFDHGGGSRRAAAARPRRHARVAVRDRGRTQPPLPRSRARPPGLRLVEQARSRRLQRPLVRGEHDRADGRSWRSAGRTSSATRWAAAWPSRSD